MKPKILMLLSNSFDPDPRVHNEAKALTNCGYEVRILCWDRDLKSKPKEVIDNIMVERIYVRSTHGRGSGQMFFLMLFWIKVLLKGLFINFDFIHCHDFDTLPIGYALGRIKKAKVIYDSHESYVDMLSNLPFILRRFIYSFENILVKRVDTVITVGNLLRKHFERRGAKNVIVVGNWKDPADFIFPQKLLEEEKKKIGINNNQFVVCYIANLGHERQVSQLIDAVKGSPKIFLVIGGNGVSRPLVENAARSYPNIVYLGYVEPSKIPIYTSLSDAIFYGFDPENPNARFSAPNKLFEALAAGKPIICANFGEIARIIREEKCGVILDDYSPGSIKAGLKKISSGQWMELSNNARIGAKKYNWTRAKEILINAYKDFHKK